MVRSTLSRRGRRNARIAKRHFANNFDTAFNPERWARESVLIQIETMVGAGVVHRDFEPIFQQFGDVVNTRQPGEFVSRRKAKGDNVTVQDATATNIQVPLNQHSHVSFEIDDLDETISFKSLLQEYIAPAAQAQARFADLVVLSQVYQFLENQAGAVNGLTTSNAVSLIIDARTVMNNNKAHETGRQILWGTDAEGQILQNAVFHEADKRGDTQGLKEASLGRKFGFDHWMGQNVLNVLKADHTYQSGAINETGAVKGDTTVTIDGISGLTGFDVVTAGNWCTINGKVYHITAISGGTGAAPTGLTLEYGLLETVADNATVEIMDKGSVDLAAGYAVDYAKGILVDDSAGALGVTPQVGQLVTFGSSNIRYTVIEVETGATEHTIWLDRPLEAAVPDNTVVNYGPAGGFNLGLHRNAMTLAIRPLKAVPDGTGAKSSTASFNNATSRVTFAYDAVAQALMVTFDYLLGIKVLDKDLGVVVLS